mgnify:FL=1
MVTVRQDSKIGQRSGKVESVRSPKPNAAIQRAFATSDFTSPNASSCSRRLPLVPSLGATRAGAEQRLGREMTKLARWRSDRSLRGSAV